MEGWTGTWKHQLFYRMTSADGLVSDVGPDLRSFLVKTEPSGAVLPTRTPMGPMGRMHQLI